MYERYGATETPSTRYHDLVDLLLIIGRFPLDATKTLRALHIQQQRRPRLTLPTAVTAPGPEWARGYRAEARGTSLAPELQHLDAALATLAACLDPLLDGAMPVGTWNPATRHWDNSPAEA